MPDTEEIIAAIDRRLAEVRDEVASLEAGLLALRGGHVSPASPSRRATPEPRPARHKPTRGKPKSAATPELATILQPRTEATAPSRKSASPNGSTGAKSSAKARAPVRKLIEGAIEALLKESAGGLSAKALTTTTGASYGKVVARLKELESAGEVRSSGTRRTSLWHMVTDDQRIAERAAELEKAAGPKELTAS